MRNVFDIRNMYVEIIPDTLLIMSLLCCNSRMDEENLSLEFELLPPDEHIAQLRKAITHARDERWRAQDKAQKYR